jgi:hypothetical protein|tara:strand:- start:17 stop:469 length:453 start_codon:yes stop_codon:yes gene_type:complete
MKKTILILLVSLGLQTQAQVNLCDSLTISGAQTQFQIEVNGLNTFIVYWVTTSSDSVVFQEDSMSIYQTVYNQLYDTLTTCITYGISTTNTCCVTWIWDGTSWAKMMLITNIEEVNTTKLINNKMYDLYGREILKPKGLYIKNNQIKYEQ